MSAVLFWSLLLVLCLMIEAFFTMGEMSILSFNRMRLQEGLLQQNRRAYWVKSLLQDPSRLFGTVLFGSNIGLQMGAESSRHLYIALGLNPDWAPFSQFFFVVIFAELAPLFAARRSAEAVALWQSPILFAVSKLLSPVLWVFSQLIRLMNRFFGAHQESVIPALSRQELQKVLEAQEDAAFFFEEREQLGEVVSALFDLKERSVEGCYIPVDQVKAISSSLTVGQCRELARRYKHTIFPIYQRLRKNLSHLVDLAELAPFDDQVTLSQVLISPLFLATTASLLDAVVQMRAHPQQAAIVVDEGGQTVGMLTFEDCLEAIFHFKKRRLLTQQIVEKSFPASKPIQEVNEELDLLLPTDSETLGKLLKDQLGHYPEEGDTVLVKDVQLTVKELSLFNVKRIAVRHVRHEEFPRTL